jgi:type I restriction enzyme M protein
MERFLERLSPSRHHNLSRVRSSRNVFAAGMMDAEHHQPRYEYLLKHSSKYTSANIGDMQRRDKRGIQPVYDDDGICSVVDSRHLGSEHIGYDDLQKTNEKDFNASPEVKIQFEDLSICSNGAYVGGTNIHLDAASALAGNHVDIRRLSNNVDHAYMASAFQSILAFKFIIRRHQTIEHTRESARAELYPYDVDKFVVPILHPEKRKEICNLAKRSLEKHREAFRFLEYAKRTVEIAIEESEVCVCSTGNGTENFK